MMKKLLPILFLFIINILTAQTISEIQGTGADSPYINQTVTTSGIVTAVDGNGYFIQDGTAVRSGIYIYDQSNTPSLGDQIEITGVVTEFFELTEISTLTAASVLSSGNPLPAPIELSTNDINQEDYEGMLVKVNQATCTNANIGFGEFELNDGSGACAVDDLFYLYSATEGIDYNVTGPMTYSFSAYKIEPRDENDIEIAIPLYFTVDPRETTINTTSLTVSWETNIPATSIIEYGLTPALELGDLSDLTMSATHELTLTSLSPGTIYYVRPYSESGADITPTSTLAMATASLSSGTIKAYFNHEVEYAVATVSDAVYTDLIADTIIAYINLAQSTLDFTMYEAQNEEIVTAINEAYGRGIIVRVVSDDAGDNDVLVNNLDANIPILEGNTAGIMHNKFMIVDRDDTDNAWVLTGSMNHTVANLGWDYNNVICIQDQSLARGYTLEFEEMWGSTESQPDINNAKFGAQKTDNTPHRFNINGIAVESYFSPSDGVAPRIVAAIDAAESEVAFAILVFTENSLGNAVLDAHNRGVDVKGIIDYVEFNGSEFDYLLNNGVAVMDYQNVDGSQWPDGPTLHHKYAIIDYAEGSANPLLITGSHNWSASAGSIHDENTLLIYDAEVANWYQQEFWARFFGIEISTEEQFIENKLQVFPNPMINAFEVELPTAGQLQLFDLQGKVVFTKEASAGFQNINISNLPRGTYILLFKNEKANYIERIVKVE
jgi:phosphatidylserine/phosphatidylglycerophosphate/cardiolipin synthase-like enzyme